MKKCKCIYWPVVMLRILLLLEIGFAIASWVWVFLNPDNIFIRGTANLTTVITLITLWGMTLSRKIRQLRENNKELEEISRSIRSRLMDENAELHKQHLADQQKILMQDAELKSLHLNNRQLYLNNRQLEDAWKQLEDLMKQHRQNGFTDEGLKP